MQFSIILTSVWGLPRLDPQPSDITPPPLGILPSTLTGSDCCHLRAVLVKTEKELLEKCKTH